MPTETPQNLENRSTERPWGVLLSTALALAALLLWDGLDLDLTLARWFGTSAGFALRDHWLFVKVLHQGARNTAWLLEGLLVAGIWWPLGPLQTIGRRTRVQLAMSTLVALALVSFIKFTSTTSCPWDLQDFGGTASYMSHWVFGAIDGGGGHCFPAGHASAGFAFLSGYFVFRSTQPALAHRWLAVALLTGFVLGTAQQMRGAHFMSHTLWTAWICWISVWACDGFLSVRNNAPAP